MQKVSGPGLIHLSIMHMHSKRSKQLLKPISGSRIDLPTHYQKDKATSNSGVLGGISIFYSNFNRLLHALSK